jgi:hypothetical protein
VPSADDADPVSPTTPALSPEDLKRIEDCHRISTFQNAGKRVLAVASAEPSNLKDALLGVAGALEQLVPIAPESERGPLVSMVAEARQRIGAFKGDPMALLAEVNGRMADEAARVTALLTSLQPLCPEALKSDELNQAERLRLGQPVPI